MASGHKSKTKQKEIDVRPTRQIRASYNDDTITVYQAYPNEIADAALNAGRFVPPFKRDRMTWIKPSFLWMAYRSGWATKPNQERILAIDITRSGFEWALANSSLSHHDPGVHGSHEDWKRQLATSSVRIQWDPERSLNLEPLTHRAIQIGIGHHAVDHYVDEWTRSITEITSRVKDIHELAHSGEAERATALLPNENPYPLSGDMASRIGIERDLI